MVYNLGPNGVTISATINPNGSATTLSVDYGLTPDLGETSAGVSAGSGTAAGHPLVMLSVAIPTCDDAHGIDRSSPP